MDAEKDKSECKDDIIKTTQCCEKIYYEENYAPHNIITHHELDDLSPNILLTNTNVVTENVDNLFQHRRRLEIMILYTGIAILFMLTIATVIFGVQTQWFSDFTHNELNPYIVLAVWIITVLISYIAIYILWKTPMQGDHINDMYFSIFILIGEFLTLFAAAVFFQAQNIRLAAFLAAMVFLYYFWLFVYCYNLKIKASFFIVPLVLMYAFLFYLVIHFACLNDILL